MLYIRYVLLSGCEHHSFVFTYQVFFTVRIDVISVNVQGHEKQDHIHS